MVAGQPEAGNRGGENGAPVKSRARPLPVVVVEARLQRTKMSIQDEKYKWHTS